MSDWNQFQKSHRGQGYIQTELANMYKKLNYKTNFNHQAYMGKWFQIARIPQFYETNCANATAEYTFLKNKIKVFNTCYDQNGNVIRTITGQAMAPNPSQPTKLLVTFPGVPQMDKEPNYIIHNTDYNHYAIIGSTSGNSFYILSRKPTMNIEEYMQWLEYAASLGYDPMKVEPNYHTLTK